MKRILVADTTIRGIAPEGLRYVDDAGRSYWIDFVECRRNWAAFVNSGEEFPGAHLAEEESWCVAWRDANHKPPYIEFFTQPRTRFEFAEAGRPLRRLLRRLTHSRYADFLALQRQIGQVGWKTYDLS